MNSITHIKFLPGDILRIGDERFQLNKMLDRNWLATNLSTTPNSPRLIEKKELDKGIASQEIELIGTCVKFVSASKVLKSGTKIELLKSYPELKADQAEELEWRLQCIDARHNRLSTTETFKDALKRIAEASGKNVQNIRTVQVWASELRDHNNDIRALFDKGWFGPLTYNTKKKKRKQ